MRNPGQKLKLCFICDGYNFEKFHRQPYLTEAATTLKSRTSIQELDDIFQQFAWELDVERQLKRDLNKPLNRKEETHEKAAVDWDVNKVEPLGTKEDKKGKKGWPVNNGKGIMQGTSTASTDSSLLPAKRRRSEFDNSEDGGAGDRS